MAPATTPVRAGRRGEFGDSPARVATAVAALAGLLLMLVGVGLAMLNSWTWKLCAPLIVLGVGVLAVGFFVVFNFEWLGDVVTGRAALSGILVAVMCTAAVVVWAVGIYFFAYRGQITIRKQVIPLTKSWDLTSAKRFTLSDKTIGQLQELKEPLRIVVIGRLFNPYSGDRPDTQAEDLLAMYRTASSMVTLEYLRPTDEEWGPKLKALADKMHRNDPEELKFGTVVLLYKDQFKSFQGQELWDTQYSPMDRQVRPSQVFKGEETFTSAIYQMLDSKKAKVYFVWGHGERDPEGREYKDLSFARDRLQADNRETAKLMLATAEKVPDDADLLVICGPTQPFQPRELELLGEYLGVRKGRLLLCLDEYRAEADLGLDAFLTQFGVAAGRDKVVEPDGNHRIPQAAQLALAWDYSSHPVVERLREKRLPVLFGPARTVRRLDEYRGDWSADALVSGSEQSYGETDLDALYAKGQTRYDEGRDSPKPASYAVASWAGAPPVPGGRMAKELGRVAVVGDSNWCSNRLFRMFGNESFFSSTVNWMLGQEKRIAIEPKKAEGEGLTLLPAQKNMTIFAVVTLCALLLLVAGLTAWIRRR